MRVTVQLTKEARVKYQDIYQFFENDKLTVVSRWNGWDVKYGGVKPDKWETDDVVTFIEIVAGAGTDLSAEVDNAVKKVNDMYPGCALRVKNRV